MKNLNILEMISKTFNKNKNIIAIIFMTLLSVGSIYNRSFLNSRFISILLFNFVIYLVIMIIELQLLIIIFENISDSPDIRKKFRIVYITVFIISNIIAIIFFNVHNYILDTFNLYHKNYITVTGRVNDFSKSEISNNIGNLHNYQIKVDGQVLKIPLSKEMKIKENEQVTVKYLPRTKFVLSINRKDIEY